MTRLCLSLLFLAASLQAASVALTGRLVDSAGNGINGTLNLSISKNAALIVASGCAASSGEVTPNVVTRIIVSNGALLGSPTVWGNDCVSPPDTYYNVRVADNSGNTLFTDYWVLVGQTVDVGTIVSATVNGTFDLGGASLATLVNGVLSLSELPHNIPASYITGLNQLTMFNVWSYGAHHDGFTDDSAAFQNAEAAAELAGGGEVYVPCGSYLVASGTTVKKPSVSVVGAQSGCVFINHTGNNSFLTFQMNPFTPDQPAGMIGGMTITGNNGANAVAIRTGSVVGAHFYDLAIRNYTGTNGIGMMVENVLSAQGGGNAGAGWFERNVIERVQVVNCTTGIELIIDGGMNSFGYNTWEQVAFNTVTGQVGFRVTSAGSGGPVGTGPYFYHNFFRAIYNGAGGTGIYIQGTSSNWDQNQIAYTGEGDGTPNTVSLKVDAGNQGVSYGYMDVVNASAVNNAGIMSNGNPHFAIYPNKMDSTQDGGTMSNYNGSGQTATLYPLNIVRGAPVSFGYAIGNNVSSPYVSMFNAVGNEFDIYAHNFNANYNSPIKVGSVDANGNAYFSGVLLAGVTPAAYNNSYKADINGGLYLRACQTQAAAAGALNLGGCTATGRAGLYNMFANSTSGINENLGFGDTNWSSGVGSVIGNTISHPMAWGLAGDPIVFEWYSKPFGTALVTNNRVAWITTGGAVVANRYQTTDGQVGATQLSCPAGQHFLPTSVDGGIIVAGVCQ